MVLHMERESTSALYPVFRSATVATMDMASVRYIGCTIQNPNFLLILLRLRDTHARTVRNVLGNAYLSSLTKNL